MTHAAKPVTLNDVSLAASVEWRSRASEQGKNLQPRVFKNVEDYQIQLCLNEIAHLKGTDWQTESVWCMPHIRRFLALPTIVFVARHIQRLIWTSLGILDKILNPQLSESAVNQTKLPVATKIKTDATVRRKIYLDVSATARGIGFGGIPRTVRKLIEASQQRQGVIPVVGKGDQLWPLGSAPTTEPPISFAVGDIYVLLDQFWHPSCDFEAICKTVYDAGASSVVCIYDVIPYLYPALMAPTFVAMFNGAFPRALASFDRIVTISSASAEEIKSVLPCHQKDVGVFRLGSDATATANGPVRNTLRRLCANGRVFLSVGSVLPHKGHVVAIAAMEELWREGHEAFYLILGKRDATLECISEIIVHHPEYNERLVWVPDASDAELAYCYEHATCLIQPSICEGFGLPIVEAQSYEVPIIASDIKIFREIGGDDITFFDCCDSRMLANCIRAFLIDARSRPGAATGKSGSVSWSESLDSLIESLDRT